MDFFQLATDRYSVRKFSDKPVPQEIIDKIIRAGYVAPTACNKQPIRILVCNKDESLASVKKCTECHFDAPVAMLILYDKNECWKRSFDGKTSGDIDASIITTHMMLAAHDLGLGSTWVMYFVPEAVRCEFKVPDNLEPTAMLMLGYPAEDAKPSPGHTQYRPLDELVSYNNL